MDEEKTAQEKNESELMKGVDAEPKLVIPRKGEKIKGTIISISESAVLIDCGAKSEAILEQKELEGQKVGDEIEGVVIETEPELKISLHLQGQQKTSEDILQAFKSGLAVHGKITGAIKGGFNVEISGRRAFLPLSQLDLHFVDNVTPYLGKSYDFKIIEYNPDKEKIIVSRTALLKQKQKAVSDEAWDKIQVNAVLKGKVRSIQSFGAFVDLGGIDGLVHISEISQGYTNHPSEILSIGQEVEVKVIKADKAHNRISLSMKELTPDPWQAFADTHTVGDKFSGAIVRKAEFGLFVELEPGIDGLLHVSQLLPDTDKNDTRYDVGMKVEGWLRGIDLENRRVSLTLREDENPKIWDNLPEKYAVDNVLEGKIEEVTKYGVFVELEPGLTGLMPLSELKKLGFHALQNEFKASDSLKVKITALDTERKRISLAPQDIQPHHSGPVNGEPRRKKSAAKRRTAKRSAPSHHGDSKGSVTNFGARLAAALQAKKTDQD